MKKMSVALTGILLISCFAHAQDSYIAFDDDGNMVLSGPFGLTIPRPAAAARIGGPETSKPSLLNERLMMTRAGFFDDAQLVIVEVETTNTAPGTLTDQHLPVMQLGGRDFRARKLCVDISQEELNMDDDPLFEFIEVQNVQIVPAVMLMQLVAVNNPGTALGTILFARNASDGCDAVTAEFEQKFTADFERFIESIRAANSR